MKTLEKISIKDLFKAKTMDFYTSQMLHSLGLTSKAEETNGITVSVKIDYPLFVEKEDVIRGINENVYNSIKEHNELFTFVRAYGSIKSLEDFQVCTYKHWYLWVKIKDISAMGQNCLIFTHGHAPDRYEAFYRAKSLEDFWDAVKTLTDMCDGISNVEEFKLSKENGMLGSSYKKWDFIVKQ